MLSPTVSSRRLAAATSTIAAASVAFSAIGFSQMTCTPAWSARVATARWLSGMVQTLTRSSPPVASSSR
jgi:hypothetical protein